MRDEARKKNSSQFADDMKQMRNQARDMAEKQSDIQKKIEEQASQPKALSDSGESEKRRHEADDEECEGEFEHGVPPCLRYELRNPCLDFSF